MSLRVLADLTEVVFCLIFATSIAFCILYTYWHNWWKTVYGRCIFALSADLALITFRGVLKYLFGIQIGSTGGPWDWATILVLYAVPVTFAALSWLLINEEIQRNKK